MKNDEKSCSAVDEYISQFPGRVQAILKRIRKIAKRAAPEAIELISYQMPALKLHGILIYYAAWKEHIGLYPPIKGDTAIEHAVARYAGPKGNLQFPLDQPIPYNLIQRIVELRVEQNAAKASAKRQEKQSKRKK